MFRQINSSNLNIPKPQFKSEINQSRFNQVLIGIDLCF
ncbi:unnamed protein product [Brassica oleracea var. botrytis]